MPKEKTTRQHKTIQKQGITFNKDHGQHILKNIPIITSMIEKAALLDTDVVLEVGPGTGNLTVKLLEKVRKVIACEIDTRLVAELKKRVQNTPYSNKLEINVGDVIKKDLPFFNVCVSNLPYNISSKFIEKLLSGPDFRCAILMLQKEFAMRLLAKPGDKDYSRLSVNVQLRARVDHLMHISRNSFRPPPKVDSSVIRIELLKDEELKHFNFKLFDNFLKICFLRKNKTIPANFNTNSCLRLLENNYRNYCKISKIKVPEDLDIKTIIEGVFKNFKDSKYAPKELRSRSLTIDHFLVLFNLFSKANIYFV